MKINVDRKMFIEGLRELFDDSCFTHRAKNILFDHLEELEEKLDEEFDIKLADIAILYHEMTESEFIEQYNTKEQLEKINIIKIYEMNGVNYILFKEQYEKE